MKPEVWAVIDSLRRHIDDEIAALRPGSGGAVAAPNLGSLAQKVRLQLANLHDQLRLAHVRDPDRFVLLMVCFVDERAIRRLPIAARDSWPWLQSEWLQSLCGGTVFFEILHFALAANDEYESHVAAADYCLAHGFRGRYAEFPDEISDLRTAIAQRLAPRRRDHHAADDFTSVEILPSSLRLRVPLVYGASLLSVLGLLWLFASWR
jgi:type VI protein secretion system component VasF